MTDGAPYLVEVALPLPVEGTFTYSVSGGESVAPGTRVLVPFRREERIGWVVGPASGPPPKGLKAVLDVLESEPSATTTILELSRWLGEYYVAPFGLALRSAMPALMTDATRHYVALVEGELGSLRPREARVVAELGERGGRSRVRMLRRALDMGSIWPEVRSLVARGLLRYEAHPPKAARVKTVRTLRVTRWLDDLAVEEALFGRSKRQSEAYGVLRGAGGTIELGSLRAMGFSRSVVKGLLEKELVEAVDVPVVRDPFGEVTPDAPARLTPTPAQEAALAELCGALRSGSGGTYLLHGITGSGKTLVYIELIRDALARGRSAIVLVPEIALTPQTVGRFRSQFGDQIAVLHSGLSDGERYDAWRELRSGRRRVAVGARSALFAPLEDLGVVVVDEEHDGSYKQGETPRYHARDLAVVRSTLQNAVCVLGSATPSLESWSNARRGKFELLSLPERAGGGSLPPVRIVDLREARKLARRKERPGSFSEAGLVLSPDLVDAVRVRLDRREQTILLLNRRGYSAFLQCRECGSVEVCPNCAVSLTYHRRSRTLRCHHCRHDAEAPLRCPRCTSADLSYRGLGTEQVERVVAETFPSARVARMDVDTTGGKWSHHRILSRVRSGEVDILLGTQMIAKGLDFPNVTLVGVVNADVGIHLPDFRATERTFQLLSQVSGRAGRGPKGGVVLIQTSLPDHYAIDNAVRHDFEGFAAREMGERLGPGYPPHVRLVNVVVSSPDADAAAREAERLASWLRTRRLGPACELVGPAPSPIERLHNRWRWHVLIRSGSPRALGAVGWDIQRNFRTRGGDVRVVVDRDPTALL